MKEQIQSPLEPEKEPPESLLEKSGPFFQRGLESFNQGHNDQAQRELTQTLAINPYDIGAMVLLSYLDPDFQREQGLFESPEHRQTYEAIILSPHVRNMHQVSNNMIEQTCQGQTSITIVDIGIGSGTQEARLFD